MSTKKYTNLLEKSRKKRQEKLARGGAIGQEQESLNRKS
jgi:hypothetical protein